MAYSRKSEMEEFFLKCIDEARRELMRPANRGFSAIFWARKKHITVNWQKSDREKVLEAMLSNEDPLEISIHDHKSCSIISHRS